MKPMSPRSTYRNICRQIRIMSYAWSTLNSLIAHLPKSMYPQDATEIREQFSIALTCLDDIFYSLDISNETED